jgi:hypothetical protein
MTLEKFPNGFRLTLVLLMVFRTIFGLPYMKLFFHGVKFFSSKIELLIFFLLHAAISGMTTFLKLFLLRPTLWLCDTLADA